MKTLTWILIGLIPWVVWSLTSHGQTAPAISTRKHPHQQHHRRKTYKKHGTRLAKSHHHRHLTMEKPETDAALVYLNTPEPCISVAWMRKIENIVYLIDTMYDYERNTKDDTVSDLIQHLVEEIEVVEDMLPFDVAEIENVAEVEDDDDFYAWPAVSDDVEQLTPPSPVIVHKGPSSVDSRMDNEYDSIGCEDFLKYRHRALSAAETNETLATTTTNSNNSTIWATSANTTTTVTTTSNNVTTAAANQTTQVPVTASNVPLNTTSNTVNTTTISTTSSTNDEPVDSASPGKPHPKPLPLPFPPIPPQPDSHDVIYETKIYAKDSNQPNQQFASSLVYHPKYHVLVAGTFPVSHPLDAKVYLFDIQETVKATEENDQDKSVDTNSANNTNTTSNDAAEHNYTDDTHYTQDNNNNTNSSSNGSDLEDDKDEDEGDEMEDSTKDRRYRKLNGVASNQVTSSSSSLLTVSTIDSFAWQQVQTFSSRVPAATPSINSFDAFGSTLAMNDDFLVVGAPYASDVDYYAGRVYFYDLQFNSQTQQVHTIPHTALPYIESLVITSSGSFFGSSVSISNNSLVAVGAPRDSLNGLFYGAVYLYEYFKSSKLWKLDYVLIEPKGSSNSHFGSKVVLIDDSMVAVSAPGTLASAVVNQVNQVIGNNSGVVYVYSKDDNDDDEDEWIVQSTLIPPIVTLPNTSNKKKTTLTYYQVTQFGYNLHFTAEYALVSAYLQDLSTTSGTKKQGVVFVYRYDTVKDVWVYEDTLFSPTSITGTNGNTKTISTVDEDNTDFGVSLAIETLSFPLANAVKADSSVETTILLIGSPSDAQNRGAVYVFTLPYPSWIPTVTSGSLNVNTTASNVNVTDTSPETTNNVNATSASNNQTSLDNDNQNTAAVNQTATTTTNVTTSNNVNTTLAVNATSTTTKNVSLRRRDIVTTDTDTNLATNTAESAESATVTVSSVTPASWVCIQKFTGNDTLSGDRYGASIAINSISHTVFIGAISGAPTSASVHSSGVVYSEINLLDDVLSSYYTVSVSGGGNNNNNNNSGGDNSNSWWDALLNSLTSTTTMIGLACVLPSTILLLVAYMRLQQTSAKYRNLSFSKHLSWGGGANNALSNKTAKSLYTKSVQEEKEFVIEGEEGEGGGEGMMEEGEKKKLLMVNQASASSWWLPPIFTSAMFASPQYASSTSVLLSEEHKLEEANENEEASSVLPSKPPRTWISYLRFHPFASPSYEYYDLQAIQFYSHPDRDTTATATATATATTTAANSNSNKAPASEFEMMQSPMKGRTWIVNPLTKRSEAYDGNNVITNAANPTESNDVSESQSLTNTFQHWMKSSTQPLMEMVEQTGVTQSTSQSTSSSEEGGAEMNLEDAYPAVSTASTPFEHHHQHGLPPKTPVPSVTSEELGNDEQQQSSWTLSNTLLRPHSWSHHVNSWFASSGHKSSRHLIMGGYVHANTHEEDMTPHTETTEMATGATTGASTITTTSRRNSISTTISMAYSESDISMVEEARAAAVLLGKDGDEEEEESIVADGQMIGEEGMVTRSHRTASL